MSSYNPFIWNNSAGYGRGFEIHLPGKKPTSLANSGLFGKNADNTNLQLNRFYTSKPSGLPWALDIPVKFDYPLEKTDINKAYLKFSNWVQSNGSIYIDWYSNQIGYRNNNYIY